MSPNITHIALMILLGIIMGIGQVPLPIVLPIALVATAIYLNAKRK